MFSWNLKKEGIMVSFLYKAIKSLIPCFLLTTAIGWTYAFSLFSGPV